MKKCYVVETSPMAPWQLEGICEDGRYIHIKARGGVLRVRLNESASKLYSSKPVLIRELDDKIGVFDIIKSELGLEVIIIGEAWGE